MSKKMVQVVILLQGRLKANMTIFKKTLKLSYYAKNPKLLKQYQTDFFKQVMQENIATEAIYSL